VFKLNKSSISILLQTLCLLIGWGNHLGNGNGNVAINFGFHPSR